MASMLANFTMANSKGLYPRLSGKTTKRRAKKNRSAVVRRARVSKRRARPARLVKGSAAAKAYMAKIRRKRRR